MTDRRHQLVPLLKGLFAVVVWGASFIATKIALRDVSPVTIIWLRFGIGVAILGVIVAARRERVFLRGKELRYFALLGLFGITFHQWLQSTGLITSQATTTAWIVASIPIFIALLGWLFLRERLSTIGAGGIVLAALGVLLVVSRGELHSLFQGRFAAPGDLLILLSAPNWAAFSILSRHGLRYHSPSTMMLFVMGFGWLFTTFLFLVGGGPGEIGNLTKDGWMSLLFLGVFCSGVAYVFWYDALKEIPAARVGSLLYLEPLVAVAVAAVFLQEPFLFAAFAGGGMILTGVWLVNRPAVEIEGLPD